MDRRLRRGALALAAVCVLGLVLTGGSARADSSIGPAQCNQTDLQSAITAGGTITFSADCTVDLTSALTLSAGVTIDGTGHTVVLDGQGSTQILSAGSGSYTLTHLILQNGSIAGNGGAVFLANAGTLSVTASTFANDTANNGGAIFGDFGATVTVGRSTFVGDSSPFANGGAIETQFGTITVTNDTFTGNTGGDVFDDTGTATVNNDTFVNTSANGAAAVKVVGAGTASISYSLFSGNASGDCFTLSGGSITDNGYNLTDSDGSTCGFTNGTNGDITGTDAHLGSLANNGGSTETMALTDLSPPAAVDTQTDCGLATDQRGVSRPTSHCSIGAYQYDYAHQTISTCDEPNLDGAVAIATAEATSTIAFGCDGTIPLSGRLDIPSGDVTLDGNGHAVTISGGNSVLLFDLGGSRLTVDGLTLADGHGVFGGTGIQLTVADSTITGSDNGVIHLDNATVTATNTTFANNSVGQLGVVYNGTQYPATFTNDTFVNNTDDLPYGTGAALATNTGTITLADDLFNGNGIAQSAGTPTNCYVSGGGGGVTDNGYNLADGGASGGGCGFSGGNNDALTDAPNLGPLADNGGQTHTMALTDQSPPAAVDTHADCGLATDQRGVTRPLNHCSIGAYQYPDPSNQTLTSCTEADLDGMVAIAAAEPTATVHFGCDGTIDLTNPVDIGSNTLTLDATGHTVALDGQGSTQILSGGSGTYTVTHLTLQNGSSGFAGAAIFAAGGTLNVSGSTITGNTSASVGGAIVARHLTLSSSTVSGNSVTNDGGHGGAVYIQSGGTGTLSRDTFTSNSTTTHSSGGAVYDDHATVTVAATTFSGNSQGFQSAGAAVFSDHGHDTFTNDTFSGNSTFDGAGSTLYAVFGTETFANDTIAGGSGGVPIYNDQGTVSLAYTLFSGNGADCDGYPFTDNGHNLTDTNGSGCGLTNGVNGDITSTDAHLGSLASNGGPTKTRALTVLSPPAAVDTHANCGLLTDQRGVTRQLGHCSIGPYQYTHPNNQTLTTCDEASLDGMVAIARTESPATLHFGCNGTIYLTSQVDLGGGTLTLDATGHTVALDGQGSTRILSGGSGVYALTHLTLQNGSAPGGGGGAFAMAPGGTLSVTDSTFTNNSTSSADGGAIDGESSTVNVDGSTFSSNQTLSSGSGGAIAATNLTATNSTFTDNTSVGGDARGGAIYLAGGTGTLSHDIFTGNSAATASGTASGGAVADDHGTMSLSSVTFSENEVGAEHQGAFGGAFSGVGSNDTLTNVTFEGNSATGAGPLGTAISASGPLTLANDTIADGAGGNPAVAVYGATAHIGYTIFSGNGSDCVNIANSATFMDDGYNVTDTDGTSCNFGGSSTVSTAANLGPLADYGGSVQTIALQATSAAAAQDTGTTCTPSTDARGVSRPSNNCSSGAFQYDVANQWIGTCDRDTLNAAVQAGKNVTGSATIRYGRDCTVPVTSHIFWFAANNNLTIDGNGHDVTLDGQDTFGSGLFEFAGCICGGDSLTLNGLTMTNFQFDNGGIVNEQNAYGSVIVKNSVLENSSAAFGGAILAAGPLVVTNTTFSGNSGSDGSAIYGNGGTGYLSDNTFVGNTGAAAVDTAGTLHLKNDLFSGNDGTCGGGGGGTFADDGYNLADTSGCGFLNGTNNDIVGSDPLLTSLGNHGGTVDTYALTSLSPAIDAGSCTDAQSNTVTTDARGVARPQGSTCDIGAYEAAAHAPSTTLQLSPASPNGSNGWYRTQPTAKLNVTDANVQAKPKTFFGINTTCSPADTSQCTTDTPQFTIPDGDNTVSWFTRDTTPSYESRKLQEVKVDSVAPSTALDTGGYTPGTWTNSSVQVTLNPTDATSGVASTQVMLDGGSTVTYSTPFTLSDQGDHSLVYWSTDVAGNNESHHTAHIKIDTAAPATMLHTGTYTPGTWTKSSVAVSFTSTDALSGVASTQYTLDGGSPQTYSGPFAIGADGDHTVTYWSTDKAGNVESTHTVHVMVDKTAPSTALDTGSYTPNTWTNTSVQVTLNPSDATSGVATTQYTLDGGAPQTYSAPFTVSAEGDHTLMYWSTDNAGNAEAHHTVHLQIESDGEGTLTAGVPAVSASSHNTLVFKYTAPALGVHNGAVSFLVPADWSTPSTTPGDPGYTVAAAGSVSVSGQTVTVSGLTLAGGASVTIAYGSKTGGGPGAVATSSPGSQSWNAKETPIATGTPAALSTSPSILVVAPDGSGTLATPTSAVSATATGRALTFTYHVAAGGMSGGALTLMVPTGWSAPSTTGSDPGFVVASAGTVSVSGQTITVSGITASAGATITLAYGSKGSGGPGATVSTGVGLQSWSATEKSATSGKPTSLASSPQIQVYAADGSGTLTASSSAVSASATGQTLTFTYKVAAGGMAGGSVRLIVSSGWSAPSTTGTNPGYVTASDGTVGVSAHTVTVSGLTKAAGQHVTIVYGSTAGGGPGASDPTSPATQTWTSSEQSIAMGTLTALASSPVIQIYARDGSGTIGRAPASVVHGSTGNTVTFTYTVGGGGTSNGTLTIVVPAGWSNPQKSNAAAAGYTSASAGTVTISGHTITVSGLTKTTGQTVTVTYTNATAPPTAVGSQTWTSQERSTAGGVLTSLAVQPAITVN